MVLSFVLLLLDACVGQTIYEEPAGGPQAKVHVLLAQHAVYPYSMTAAVYDPVACRPVGQLGRVADGAQADTRSAGKSDSVSAVDGPLERRIVAGRELGIGPGFMAVNLHVETMATGAGTTLRQEDVRRAQAGACRVPLFTPEDGAEYEIVVSPAPGICDIQLLRLSRSPDGSVKRTRLIVPDARYASFGGSQAAGCTR